MADFLQMVESIQTESANIQSAFSKLGSAEKDGTRPVRSLSRHQNPTYMAALAEAAEFTAEVYQGRRSVEQFREAMTTSDFPLLFGDIIDRQVLANYQAWPTTYRQFARIATVSDFRDVKRFEVFGAEARLSKVEEQAEYPEGSLTEAKHTYRIAKYGRRMPFSFEAITNDDLNALQDIPARFGRAAARTEEFVAVSLFAGDTTFFNAGTHANVVTGNPVLSIAGLQTAMNVLAAMKDTDGEPIAISSAILVVPPNLRIVAQNILNATQIWYNDAAGGGNANERVIALNWMNKAVTPVVTPYLPIVDATNGNTAWYLFANPAEGKPAIEVGFLRGHETPEVFMKSPNTVRVGGGLVSAFEGDFETDTVMYKVRSFIGGGQMSPKMAVMSNGTGA